jgi:hypothetical protein
VTLLEKDAHSGEAGKKCWCGHHNKFHEDDVCLICQNRAIMLTFKEMEDARRPLLRYTEKNGSPT